MYLMTSEVSLVISICGLGPHANAHTITNTIPKNIIHEMVFLYYLFSLCSTHLVTSESYWVVLIPGLGLPDAWRNAIKKSHTNANPIRRRGTRTKSTACAQELLDKTVKSHKGDGRKLRHPLLWRWNHQLRSVAQHILEEEILSIWNNLYR